MKNTSSQRCAIFPKLNTDWDVIELKNLSSYFPVVLSQATLTRNISNALYRGKEITPEEIVNCFHQALNISTDNAISVYAGINLLK